jgi:hypothetical protein
MMMVIILNAGVARNTDQYRVPDAVQRLFGAAPQSRDPLARVLKDKWTPDQPRITPPKGGALRSIRGTMTPDYPLLFARIRSANRLNR